MWAIFDHPELYPKDRLKGVMPEDLHHLFEKRYSLVASTSLSQNTGQNKIKTKRKRKRKKEK